MADPPFELGAVKLRSKLLEESESDGVEGAEADPTNPGVGRLKVTEAAVIVVSVFASHALTMQPLAPLPAAV